jgi:hypothetical protein
MAGINFHLKLVIDALPVSLLPLKDRQELIRRAERHDYQRRSVCVAKLAVVEVAFGLPGTVGLLVIE